MSCGDSLINRKQFITKQSLSDFKQNLANKSLKPAASNNDYYQSIEPILDIHNKNSELDFKIQFFREKVQKSDRRKE